MSTTPNDAKHTPGPWFVDPSMDGRSRGYVRTRGLGSPAGEGRYVAVARVTTNCGTNSDEDATLIAAAPELLAACKFASKFAAMQEQKGAPLPSQLVDCLNAAIEKAEGATA